MAFLIDLDADIIRIYLLICVVLKTRVGSIASLFVICGVCSMRTCFTVYATHTDFAIHLSWATRRVRKSKIIWGELALRPMKNLKSSRN